eukprot:1161529-Pelagomonas_calceolata.AAC.8
MSLCDTQFFALLRMLCLRPLYSAILAHTMLKERLNVFGIVGCGLCITGALTIILHAPEEKAAVSVVEVWQLAKQPRASTVVGMAMQG